jgi:hypothetical protein
LISSFSVAIGTHNIALSQFSEQATLTYPPPVVDVSNIEAFRFPIAMVKFHHIEGELLPAIGTRLILGSPY